VVPDDGPKEQQSSTISILHAVKQKLTRQLAASQIAELPITYIRITIRRKDIQLDHQSQVTEKTRSIEKSCLNVSVSILHMILWGTTYRKKLETVHSYPLMN
jgi:hypothetical protein